MKKDTLEDGIARSQAREARESRRAGRDAPSDQLGGPPEPWETAIGDAGERVSRQGRAVVEYAEKMNAMGINERSLAGNENPIADHVASMGQDKIRLLSGVPIGPTYAAGDPKASPDQDATAEDDDDANSVSSDWSNMSDENKAAPPQAQTNVTDATTTGGSDFEADGESSNDMDLIDDSDIRNAVEDFDSRNWTMEQLEVSCQTLLEECYASEDRRRRLLSAGMLLKLVETYPSALRWMQRNLEAVVNDGLPGMIKGILDARVFKLDILLGILAPAMAESMTQLNVVARVLRLMVYRMDTAVRVIVFRYTYPRWIAQYRALPGPIAAHKRMTLLMQGVELRARWRRVKADKKHGSLPPSLLHAYLCIILALIDAETCPKFCRMNRVKVVGACGLLALGVHFKTGDRSQRLACRILRELAREPLLIYELLNAGVAEYLSRLLLKLREASIDRLLEALDAVDSMAFSAMRFCELSDSNPNRGEGNLPLVAALVAGGSSIGGLESEIRIPNGDKVKEIVRAQLGLPSLVATLTGLLGETDVQLYLAGVVILGKLATTVCYHSVLQEVLAYAGRALELLVQGVQSQEEIVPDMSLALFLQLCSRQEGRDGIEATDGVGMLRQLISGDQAQDSPVFLRGLTCAIAVARQGVPGSPPGSNGEGTTPSATAPPGLSLPRAGGVGRSGPPRPHPLDFEGKLYNDLVDILDAPPPAPLRAVQGLVRMGSLEAVMRFLVREDDEDGVDADDGKGVSVSGKAGRRGQSNSRRRRGPHYFRLKQRHACLGAVALHGLAVLAGPHPAIMTGSTLRYLCYSIQVTYIDLTMGKLAPGVEYPLMFRSIQLACRALAFLATSDTGAVPSAGREEGGAAVESVDQHEGGERDVGVNHGPLRRVADSLISTTAINEVACIAQMPSRAAWAGDEGFMYRHLERTVSSAAILVAGVCPVPAGERDPFTRFDEPEDETSSLQLCQPLMERLVTSVGGPLCSTLMVAESLEIIAHTCRALAKLSDNNTTIQMLLDNHDIMKALIRLGPRAPAVLPTDTKPGREETVREGSLSPDRPARAHDEDTTRVGIGANATLAGSTAVGNQPERSHDNHAQGSVKQQPDPRATVSVEGVEAGQDGSRQRRGNREYVERKKGWTGGSSSICSDGCSGRSPWMGYPVREGELAEASTRKLCSLPFDYFRVVANVARVPSGRALVQSSGALKRCLERFALDVSDCAAARLATLRCRSEISVLIGRMAGTYDRKTGAANEFILHPRYQTLRVLLGTLAISPEHGEHFGASRAHMELARHNAACALAEICKDTLRSVPLVADAGGIRLACRVANDVASPMPLLKQVLRILQGAGSFPDGVYASSISDPAVLRSLNRIANNAYPGFRPTTTSSKETRQSSASSARRIAETPKRLGGTGGVGKVAGRRENVSPAMAFNLVKPRSAESREISESAMEVAYLVGAHARKSSPRTPASPPRRNDSSIPINEQKHALDGTDCETETEQSHASPTRPNVTMESGSLHAGSSTAPGEAVTLCVAKGRGGTGAVLGRPGTYLGCGVSSCKGLGFSGEHGDVAGNLPHAAFVLRRAQDGDDGADDRCDRVTRDGDHQEEPRDSLGGGQSSDEKRDNGATGQSETELVIAGSPDVVVATPLALLSARETCFRKELIRRKEHYRLGGTRKEGDTKDDGEKREGPLHASVTYERNDRECVSSSAAVVRGGPFETPRRSCTTGSKTGSGLLAATVDVAQSPLMATTRPTEELQPGSVSRRILRLAESSESSKLGRERDKIDNSCRDAADQPNERCTGAPPGRRCASPGGKEFVTFARPAAHWSVTNGLAAKSGRARIKGIRVPGAPEEGSACVVGRFACRGYLLDPTFTDHNPVILHPRLPHIGGGFRQFPEDLTLAIKASREGKSGVETFEPYRNDVEGLRHKVEVLGGRQLGKQSSHEKA